MIGIASIALRMAAPIATLVLISACGSSSESGAVPSSTVSKTTQASAGQAPVTTLGGFPAFPQGALPAAAAARLQAALDAAVETGNVRGAAAAVIVVGAGSWSGASGVDTLGRALTPESELLTASVGKTITAAQVLRLVDEGKLGLDDTASDTFPPALASFDANDATIRDLLGMRSSLTDPPYYEDLLDQGQKTADLVKLVVRRSAPAGTVVDYANINYHLLGEVVEQVTGRPFVEAVRAGPLSAAAVDGFRFRVKDAMAADGEGIAADPASLARWGYELYGGSVVSGAALHAMTDFKDEEYGLGTRDFSQDYDTPGAIGHGGLEDSHVVRLVVFPASGVVVSVQANAGGFDSIQELVPSLLNAARP